MIKYNLKCHNNHEFESWFSNSKEHDKLNKKNLLECIFCSSKKIQKSIMAPTILNTKNQNIKNDYKKIEIRKFKKELINMRKFVEKNFEFVEHNFADKVRESCTFNDSTFVVGVSIVISLSTDRSITLGSVADCLPITLEN